MGGRGRRRSGDPGIAVFESTCAVGSGAEARAGSLIFYQKLREASFYARRHDISEDGNCIKNLWPLWNDVAAMRMMYRTYVGS